MKSRVISSFHVQLNLNVADAGERNFGGSLGTIPKYLSQTCRDPNDFLTQRCALILLIWILINITDNELVSNLWFVLWVLKCDSSTFLDQGKNMHKNV